MRGSTPRLATKLSGVLRRAKRASSSATPHPVTIKTRVRAIMPSFALSLTDTPLRRFPSQKGIKEGVRMVRVI